MVCTNRIESNPAIQNRARSVEQRSRETYDATPYTYVAKLKGVDNSYKRWCGRRRVPLITPQCFNQQPSRVAALLCSSWLAESDSPVPRRQPRYGRRHTHRHICNTQHDGGSRCMIVPGGGGVLGARRIACRNKALQRSWASGSDDSRFCGRPATPSSMK